MVHSDCCSDRAEMGRMKVVGGGHTDPNFVGALENEALDARTHALAMCTTLGHCK